MKDLDDIPAVMAEIGARAKTAAQELAFASAERKYAALIGAAEALWSRREEIIDANIPVRLKRLVAPKPTPSDDDTGEPPEAPTENPRKNRRRRARRPRAQRGQSDGW